MLAPQRRLRAGGDPYQGIRTPGGCKPLKTDEATLTTPNPAHSKSGTGMTAFTPPMKTQVVGSPTEAVGGRGREDRGQETRRHERSADVRVTAGRTAHMALPPLATPGTVPARPRFTGRRSPAGARGAEAGRIAEPEDPSPREGTSSAAGEGRARPAT